MRSIIDGSFNDRETSATLQAAFRRYPEALRERAEIRYKSTALDLKELMAIRSSKGPLFRRKGRLQRSWSANVDGAFRLQNITGRVGSFASYSKDHEFGAMKTARGGGFIWIPAGPNVNAKRLAIVSPAKARRKIEAGEWRYNRPIRGSLDRSIRGKKPAVLNEESEVVYNLVKRVTIPPRLDFFPQAQIFAGQLAENMVRDGDKYWKGIPLRRLQLPEGVS